MGIDAHDPYLDAVAGGCHFLAFGIENVLAIHDAVHLDAHIDEDGITIDLNDLSRHLLACLQARRGGLLRGEKGGEIFLGVIMALLGLQFLGHVLLLKRCGLRHEGSTLPHYGTEDNQEPLTRPPRPACAKTGRRMIFGQPRRARVSTCAA